MHSDFNAEDTEVGAEERGDGFSSRPLREPLRPLRLIRPCASSVASVRLGVFALIAFFWLFGLTSAFAQINKTCNGSSNADWFQATNWTPAGVPATNDTINFGSGTIDFTAPVTV